MGALRRIRAGMERAAEAGDAWAVLEHDMELHLALFRLSGLHAMGPLLTRCMLHTHRFRLWAPWHRRSLQHTAQRHRAILDALETGDAGLLVRELGSHLDTIVERGEAAA